MPIFEILEVDRDYRTLSGIEHKEFPTRDGAKKWCRENSWTGYDYVVGDEVLGNLAKRDAKE